MIGSIVSIGQRRHRSNLTGHPGQTTCPVRRGPGRDAAKQARAGRAGSGRDIARNSIQCERRQHAESQGLERFTGYAEGIGLVELPPCKLLFEQMPEKSVSRSSAGKKQTPG